ncbi:hypothetical protein PHSY_002500 [Pseudozyma hubeiensis SY62]|uniref:Uncharacterized protein n=1 Tax=Pseudozyma hubeiensis (strain SY62) TaxID=1305764 RepID=R9P1E2_PSEHS|nr:hypothetical protein PHSY_002500 [Pseudozyma hubeiensis SY62]GAC94927.1 hypothetical protein PHSY_002500 [Pseudozyma hubeiensis SY62]
MPGQDVLETNATSADSECRPGGSALLNDLDRDLVRHKVLSLRQKRQAEISHAVSHTFDGPGARNSDRLTWIGVDEDVEHLAPPSSSSRLASSDASRSGSDDDDDADSTILGHYIQALPHPPQKLVHLDQLQRRPRPSFASEETCSSSHESSSHASCRLDDDVDVFSQHTTETTDNSSSPSSRRASSTRASIASRRLSQQSTSVDLARPASLAQALSSPIGPPPNMPLPPKPLSKTLTRALADKHKSRRSSRASASSAGSPRSAASGPSSWKMAETRPVSSRLRQIPGDRNDAPHVSDEEMDGLRDTSNHFPTPATSYPPLSSELTTAPRDAKPMLRFSPRSISGPSRATSPTADGVMYTSSGASHVRDDHVKSAEGGGSSDSALSQVLDLTESRGVLAIGERIQQASSGSQTGVFQIGLGARTLFPHKSNRQRRSTPNGPSHNPGRKSSMHDVPHDPVQTYSKQHSVQRRNHQRSDTMSKSMSELMLALDLEADEWRNGVGMTASVDLHPQPQVAAAQVSRSHVEAGESSATVPGPAKSDSNTKAELPESDSLPSLSSSVSQELSLDDSRGPPSAETSFIHPRSSKISASFRVVADNADDHGVSADPVALYDSCRLSDGTMASHFTAPALRIEDPEGDEVADSELEGDRSSDEIPRKRSKPSRKKSLGFEDQRATLRPRSSLSHHSASLTSRPSQAFRSTLVTTEEETGSTSLDSASLIRAGGDEDPYAFYEFSPSLPPFMPTGVSPRDLTGTGTWSSIVARASDSLCRQPSIASVRSLATAESGPVSLREIRATAQAKQRHADAAHRAREHMSDHIATMSYRPFAIHDHAASLAKEVDMWNAHRASASSASAVGSPEEGGRSGRSSSMSSVFAASIAPSVGDYGTRWPVAIGADQGVGPDDAASLYSFHPFSLSRRPSESRPSKKVYVEFSMQTSPMQSPTESLFPPIDSLTTDENADRADAQVGSDVREPAAFPPNRPCGYLVVDTPLRRRKSTASLLSTHDLSAELDEPGLWPSLIRAPRLSSMTRRCSEGNHLITATSRQEDSDEESDLDVNADLEDLAEHSGIMDATRGYKRKLHVAGVESTVEAQGHGAGRAIASIPARSLRISAALDRIQAQRIYRSAGWDSPDDEEEGAKIVTSRTPRNSAATGRPSLPGCDFTRPNGMTEPVRKTKSMASMAAAKRPPLSPSLLRARSPSPDLSLLTNPSDDEEVLLTEDLDLDTEELSRETILDEEFDMRIGQALSTQFSRSGKGMTQSAKPNVSGDPIDDSYSAVSRNNGGSVDGGSLEGAEDSKDSQQTSQLPTRSRTSSMSSVIEMIQEADELLSSTGHSIGHSSGHDTNISDSGGTSGHDPQRPNHVVAEYIRHRVSMRSRGLPTPVTLAVARSTRFNEPAPDKKPSAFEVDEETADFEGKDLSPSLQDTPDTTAGSEIWSSFHADRSSTVSTATTRSSGSTVEMSAAARTVSNTIALANLDKPQSNETLSAAASITQMEKRAPFVASTTRVIPILRRKSSGLPVARASVLKQSRPSLPLPSKSIPPESPVGNASANTPPKPAIRRYQSVASLQTSRDPTDSRKPAGYGSVRNMARYSDTSRATPSKSVHANGGSITPSKLPSLRSTASTTETLRSRSASEQGSGGSKIDPRLQSPIASGRSRIPSRNGVRASGLPRPAHDG